MLPVIIIDNEDRILARFENGQDEKKKRKLFEKVTISQLYKTRNLQFLKNMKKFGYNEMNDSFYNKFCYFDGKSKKIM